VLISSYASFAYFVNTLASYCIGSNTIDLEGTPSFVEANLSPSFGQGKHQASSFYRTFAFKYLLYVLGCALKCRSLLKQLLH
jgi:hypothetical protein